ncbi:MAG: hypothetical protein KDA20_08655 [Phycisphaerales bacterium]|nr:hypothetical protein [Phycisphaerales bacterium]
MPSRPSSISCALAALALLSLTTAEAALAAGYADVVTFGDSLSDNGNAWAASGFTDPPVPPYWGGRLSNGPVWVETLAPLLGVADTAMTDLAFSGAPTADIIDLQIVPYINAHAGAISPNNLYILWGGANDFLDAPLTPGSAASAAVTNLADAITLLANAGATTIVVPNLPDLTATPGVMEAGFLAEFFAGIFTDDFNNGLASTLPGLESSLGIDIVNVNTLSLFDQILANPASFGFTNVTNRIVQDDLSLVGDPNTYLFWDEIHPTAVAHAIFANWVFPQIPVPPCPEDLDGSGVIDLGDLTQVLFNFGTGAGGDVTGDGQTDLADISQVLFFFGQSC